MPRLEYFALILSLVVPLRPAALPFLVEVLLRIRNKRLGGRAVCGSGSGRLHRGQCTLSTLLLLLLFSFVDVLSLLQKCSRVLGTRDSLLPGGMLFWVTGRLFVVMVRVVLSLPSLPG